MDVNDLLVFVRVAQAGSFSKAAARLGMPVSTVSRRVAQLEEGLGVPLLLRTTRSLKITDAGRAYLEHGHVIAAELEKAVSLAPSLSAEPQGTLKITATADFGNRFLGAVVRDYLKAYPKVGVDVVLTERVVDLIDEGFDLAIRMGELDDSSLLARKLGSLDLQLYASPAFLKAHGEPRLPTDLSRFECVRFTGEDEPDTWRLSGPRGGGGSTARVSGRVSVNNMDLLRELAVAGQGIALMPYFMCEEDLKAGRLRIVLKDWAQSTGPIHVVYPGQRFQLPKVQGFVDQLLRACAGVRWRHDR